MQTNLTALPEQPEWLSLTYATPEDPLLRRWIIEILEVLTGRPKIERLYNEIRFRNVPPIDLWGLALKQLRIGVNYDAAQLAKVPKEGPVVFISNHPFGVVDGLILGDLVSKTRSRFVFLVNEVLTHDSRLADFLLPVDFHESKEAMRINLDTRARAIERIKQGEALAIFPSGGVATSPKFGKPAEDLEWKRFVIKLIQGSKATVIPVFVEGQNSWLFQAASLLSYSLRLGFLIHEIRNKMGKTVKIKIGDPIPYSELESIKDRQQLLDHLRDQVLNMKAT
jgi:putative hemolysin